MKLKTIALAALAVVAAAPAMAAIQIASTETAELFLVIGDANRSFAFDTGIKLVDFVAAANDGASPFPVQFSLTNNTHWNQYLANGGLTASTQWGLAAMGHGNGEANMSFLTTVNPSTTVDLSKLASDNLYGNLGQLNFPLSSSAQTGTHISQANGSSYNVKGTDAYFSDFAFTTGTAGINIGSKVGDSVGMVYITGSQVDIFEPVDHKFLTGVSAKFDGSNLTVTAVTAAVPEPESYALLLAGLATLGFVARRRRAD